jgi:hypothetical protein
MQNAQCKYRMQNAQRTMTIAQPKEARVPVAIPGARQVTA